ncbi:MAG: DUF5016 domain-containing protein [Prevotellaceae bacterium]|nr:DUF5016 domain-containing protein [Prevotellaceae bacterium]
MKNINKLTGLCVCALLLLASCQEEEKRTVYPHSTPVIESAGLTPGTFTYGDSLVFIAKISDAVTPLSTLTATIAINNELVTEQVFRTKGNGAEISTKIHVPFKKGVLNNAPVEALLTLVNVEGDETEHSISGLIAKRPHFDKLYLVLQNGTVIELDPQPGNSGIYEKTGLDLPNAITYLIAEKITADNQVDFSGYIWYTKDGSIDLLDQNTSDIKASDYITSKEATFKKNTTGIIFNAINFTTTLQGEDLDQLSSLSDADLIFNDTYDSEHFTYKEYYIEKDAVIPLSDALASLDVVFNVDFFERTEAGNVKFIGESGAYILYFNSTRKNVIVGVDNPSYPNYLVTCGTGLGYPTKVTTAEIGAVYSGHKRVTTGWGFDNILQYILFRKISDNVFQATVYTPDDLDNSAGFKPFENTGWANEKKAGAFIFTGESIITGDNDWTIASDSGIAPDFYRITIDLNNNTVNIEKVTLP